MFTERDLPQAQILYTKLPDHILEFSQDSQTVAMSRF